MNKGELIDAIAELSNGTKAETSRFLDALTKIITETLQKGDKVLLPGFGSFQMSYRAARTGRNPQTGDELEIKASKNAKFKAGKLLKEALQEA